MSSRCRSRRARAGRRARRRLLTTGLVRGSSTRLSVISSTSRPGVRCARASSCWTSATSSGVICRAERLAASSDLVGPARELCADLRASTQLPIGRINPVSSAIWMNWSGAISPRSGWRQRSSASKADESFVGEVDQRLVVQLELVARDGVAEVASIVIRRPGGGEARCRTLQSGRRRALWRGTSRRRRRGAAARVSHGRAR